MSGEADIEDAVIAGALVFAGRHRNGLLCIEEAIESIHRYRYAVGFSIGGDLRYLGHLDMVRLFERAAARAGLPVAYSSGFNPRPKISLPLPRSLGIASEAERLLIELQEGLDPDSLMERLAATMPPGLSIESSRLLSPGERSLPTRARYRVDWPEATLAELQTAARHFLDSESVPIARRHNKTGAVRHVDLRPFVDDIEVGPGWVDLLLHITQDGTAKPSEICKAMGYDGESMNHRIRRLEVQWQ